MASLRVVQIQVNQEERQLTLSGERRRGKASSAEEGDADSQQNRRRSERRFGKFERKFKLPEDADLDAVSARSANPEYHHIGFLCEYSLCKAACFWQIRIFTMPSLHPFSLLG